jgi:hypothetical protein
MLSQPITLHAPGTAHFLCRCGEHLVFSSGHRAFTCLEHIIRDGARKTGRCPKCSLIHSVRDVWKALAAT